MRTHKYRITFTFSPSLRNLLMMKNKALTSISIFILLYVGAAQADKLSLFTSDGCSAFPDGSLEQQTLWLNCCVHHDLAYWKGGTYEQREAADKDLEACVANVGESEIGSLMYAGVRMGGSPYFPTPYRWGYGWPYPRGYQELSSEEVKQARKQLRIFIKLLEQAEETL